MTGLFLRGPRASVFAALAGLGIGLLVAAPTFAQPPVGPVVETTGGRAGVPATTWRTVLAAGGKARIWAQTDFPEDLPKAQAIATELTDHVWRDLTGLFWEPLPDEGHTLEGVSGPFTIDAPESGGPQVDIYLVRYAGNRPTAIEHGGHAHAAFPAYSCGSSPRYLTLESDRPLGGARGFGILNALAHELAHAITSAVPWREESCEEFRWIDEATATWAEHFVYGDSQTEHQRAVRYLMDTGQPLDFEANEFDERHYGAYLFPLDLALRGHQAAIPAMWRQFASKKSLAGIEAALGGVGESLEKFFPVFMLDNWNRPSVDLYRTEDRLTESAHVPDDPEVVSLAGGHWKKKIPLSMRYLSSTYRYFRFPSGAGAITFVNGLHGHPHAKAYAIEKIDGAWKEPRELSDQSGATWCRGRPGENLEELVLVFGNTDWPKTPAEEGNLTALMARGEHELEVFGIGCTAWAGTTHAKFTMASEGETWTETSHAIVRFELDPELNRPGRPPRYWRAVSGSVRWTAERTGQCRGSFSGTLPIAIDADGNLPGTLQIWDAGDTVAPNLRVLRHWGSGSGFPDEVAPLFAYQCPGYQLWSRLTFASGWFESDPAGHTFTEGAKTLSGRWELPNQPPVTKLEWTWELHQVP